jgi:hypothetical protein
MKKSILVFALAAVFSVSVLADGDVPTGNKTCQNCLVATQQQPMEKPLIVKFFEILGWF